jgi:biopolymer transport protein ExbD
MRTSTRRKYREIIENDLEIMPLMNLFVAMIPMLLISAVFLNVTVIDLKAAPDGEDAAKNKTEPLNLAVTIRDNYFVVEGRRIKKQVFDRSDEEAEIKLGEALSGIVSKFPDNREIMIISQPHTSYGDIIAVMDISREAGLPSASLLGSE